MIPTITSIFFSLISSVRTRRFALAGFGTGVATLIILAGYSFSAASETSPGFFDAPSHQPHFLESDSLTRPDSLSSPSSASEKKSAGSVSRQDSSVQKDSLRLLPKSVRDSISRADSIRKVPRDSTARIKQFLYHRTDSPVTSSFGERSYSMFGKPPAQIMRSVTIDSTGQYVIIRETVNGSDVKIPTKVPLTEYIKMRSRYETNRYFEDMVYKYELVKKGNDLGELLGSFTNIDIPIPANPVFSIFGPPRINLHISGAVDIHAAFRNTTTDQITTSALGNTRNEPDFSQEVQINVNGTIGDKLNILADWNTQRTFEYENQLKIKYTGYEDEIVQSVEAGNVSLATNSSFISSSSALFGIKSAFQFGPLKMTTIASQKKGQIQEKNITGGSSESEFELHAYQYNTDHYFIDVSYIPLFEPFITTHQAGDGSKYINQYEVWVTNISAVNANKRQGVAYITLPAVGVGDVNGYANKRDTSSTIPGEVEVGQWDKLEDKKDYTVQQYAGYITLNRSLQQGQALAMAYRVENGPGPADDSVYGTFTGTGVNDSILVLKLIKPKSLLPQNKIAWRMLMKNIYSLGGRDIKKSGFSLDIGYKLASAEPVNDIAGVKLLRLFGFDNQLDDNSPGQDNKFDYNPPYSIDEVRGEVIFANVEPFLGMRTDSTRGPLEGGLKKAFDKYELKVPVDSFSYGDIYDTTALAAQYNSSRDRFLIKGKIVAGSSSTINLGFNIVENSVQVISDNMVLTPNVDYTVDYIVGQVIIKNQAALVPGKNLQIKFEQNDLFQLASKTLLGTRGEVRVSDNSSFGFTVMNLNQQTLSDKVRLNEEPINNTIYGFDGQTAGHLDFLTKAIDALPFVSTKASSDFTLRGEAAYMSPDPNTKKSPISIDNSKGIAYIDDFEGAKRTIPLGVNYGLWHDLSPPAYLLGIDASPTSTVSEEIKMWSKAKTYWYNVYQQVHATDIWPNKTVVPGQDFLTVLNVTYNPASRGEYNYSPSLRQTLLTDPSKNWSGMQRLLSSGIVDMVRENLNFIEIWVQVDSTTKIDTLHNKVFIDLGAINEDVIPFDQNSKRGLIHTEEKNTPNGTVDRATEDNGIDGLSDAEELATYGTFVEANKGDFPEIVNDPAGDDYAYTPSVDYQYINGTEKNYDADIGKIPNTDDLNNNNVLDKTNSYFEYELNLDTTSANIQRVGGGSNGWYQYRIPLNNFVRKIGTPDFSLIEYVRFWFTGFRSPLRMRIAEFDLVGNQWEELKKNDPTMALTVVNVEDNPDYTSPSEGLRERDRTKPDQQIYGNEQSLVFDVHGLQQGDNRQAIKRFTYKPLDVFSYREMRMFVHGDQRPTYRFSDDPLHPSAYIFMRFGVDTLNYYEYRAPILAGWHPQNNITIKFPELTSIKQGRDSLNIKVTVPTKDGPPGSTYGVRGNPTLTSIAFIIVGVENPSTGKKTSGGNVVDPADPGLTGEVWINELRLSDVDDTPGWAFSVSTSVKLADIGGVAFSYAMVDPNFHSLENRFGSRSTNKNWTLSANLVLDRFLPADWTGTSLPFNYSHTEAIALPKYLPYSDIEVEKAAARQSEVVLAKTGSAQEANDAADKIRFESQTLSTTDTYAMPTFRINIPSEKWLIRDFFNRLTYGFSYTKSMTRAPNIQFQSSWSWNAHLAYAYTFATDNYITPFESLEGVFIFGGLKDFRLYYPFQTFNASFDAVRSQTRQRTRNQAQESPPTRGLSAHRTMSFSWKLTENGFINLSGDYSVDIASTLVHLETDKFNRQRNFSSILSDLFFQDQLVNFGLDNSYSQNVNLNTHPRVPDFLDINRYFTLTAHYSVSYRWQNNLQLGDLGKGTSWGNNITLSSDVSLKQFVETWFPAKKGVEVQQEVVPEVRTGSGRNHEDDEELQQLAPGREPGSRTNQRDTTVDNETSIKHDSTQVIDTTRVRTAPVKTKKVFNPKETFIEIARLLIKTPLLDYDKVNVTFTQTNSSGNSGVPGRPGFANLFGRIPLFQSSQARFGATRVYQLGLVSEPTENITSFHTQSAFPFFGFGTERGVRAASGLINDTYSQGNKITLRTNRELWTGVRVDLNWNVGWNYSRNQSLKTDELGRPTITSTATGGSIERSFFTLPPTFIFSLFKSGVKEVSKQYDLVKGTNDKTRTEEEKLSQAFENGFESFPLFRKIFGQLLPRFNYSLHWDGLEQLSIFKGFATRVSLDHSYTSSYAKSFQGNLSGGQIVQSQRINYGFSPLIGLSMTLKELFKGNVSANIRYGATTAYDLTPSSKTIVENGSREISMTGSFGRTGFEIPFFGLSLSNDVDISFNYTFSQNSRQTFTFEATGPSSDQGVPGEGSARSVMEPRIRYVLSSRVTASLFYRYTKVTPDEGGSRIPASSTNEGGLDVHISIQ